MTRVAVCTPCGDLVHTQFAHDLAMMWGHTIRQRPDLGLVHWLMQGSLIPKQRQVLAEEAIADNCTHTLWLDTDMHFPPDTLLYMLDLGKRIVAANYVERRPPFRPVAFPDIAHADQRLYTEPGMKGQTEVDAVGFGCIMIATDVFTKMPKPWFTVGYIPETGQHVGEDVYFCMKAKEHGEQVLIDHDVSQHIEHQGSFNYHMTHALQWREAAV